MGDNQIKSFDYNEAFNTYVAGVEILVGLRKHTAVDPEFVKAVSAKINDVMERAEKCKLHVQNQLKSKETAGYKSLKPDTTAIDFLRDALIDKKEEVPLSYTNTSNNKSSENKEEQKKKEEESKSVTNSKVDKELLKQIEENIIDTKPSVKWEDIQGLDEVKKTLYETIVLPSLRPELFTGLRTPNRGILLFGPPGNGKTMIAKAVAAQCNATFFNMSASSLVSRWMGEGEKLMRALFTIAAERSPSVIFIDEIDSILTARSDSEHEASRRLKTEFLIQFDGVSSSNDARILVMGATNRPFDLDEAALRRLTKKIYIGLPNPEARKHMISHLIRTVQTNMNEKEFNTLLAETEGYSGADLASLCKEASMEPVRELSPDALLKVETGKLRSVQINDFLKAAKTIIPSVSHATIELFSKWNNSNI